MLFQILLLTLALVTSIRATPEFANHGTISGFSTTNREAQGTISDVSNVVFRPSSAIKVTQTYISGYTGRYHSEVVYNKGYHRGDTKFYGFAFRLAEGWDFEGTQSYNLAQWIADFTDTGCDDWSPTSMVYLKGSTLYSRVKTGQLLPGKPCAANKNDCSGGQNCQKTREFALQSNIEGGVWYRVTFQVTWASDATGQFKTWVNGTKVHEEYNIPTTLVDDGREFSFRLGLYANGWHDESKLVGDGFRQVWIDEVGIGSAFADGDPERL
jgi:hypothetical protein